LSQFNNGIVETLTYFNGRNMFKKFNHVSHIVKNLEEAIKLYGGILHMTPWETGIVTLKDVRMTWLPLGDNFSPGFRFTRYASMELWA
jgi:hypothetical protein